MPRTLAAPDSTRQPLAPPAVFECSLVNGDPDAVCVRVAGELDIAATPGLDVAVREALLIARLVVVDLRDVAFIDSAGLHAIVNAAARAREARRRLVVLPGPPHVERLLTLTVCDQLERGYPARARSSPAHHVRRRKRSRPISAPARFRSAGARDTSPRIRSLMTRAAAAVPWLPHHARRDLKL